MSSEFDIGDHIDTIKDKYKASNTHLTFKEWQIQNLSSFGQEVFEEYTNLTKKIELLDDELNKVENEKAKLTLKKDCFLLVKCKKCGGIQQGLSYTTNRSLCGRCHLVEYMYLDRDTEYCGKCDGSLAS